MKDFVVTKRTVTGIIRKAWLVQALTARAAIRQVRSRARVAGERCALVAESPNNFTIDYVAELETVP